MEPKITTKTSDYPASHVHNFNNHQHQSKFWSMNSRLAWMNNPQSLEHNQRSEETSKDSNLETCQMSSGNSGKLFWTKVALKSPRQLQLNRARIVTSRDNKHLQLNRPCKKPTTTTTLSSTPRTKALELARTLVNATITPEVRTSSTLKLKQEQSDFSPPPQDWTTVEVNVIRYPAHPHVVPANLNNTCSKPRNQTRISNTYCVNAQFCTSICEIFLHLLIVDTIARLSLIYIDVLPNHMKPHI